MNPSAVIRAQVVKTPGIGRAIPVQNTNHVAQPTGSSTFRKDAPVFEPQAYPAYNHYQQMPSPALFIPQQTVMTHGYGQPYVYAVPTYYQPMPSQIQPPLMAYNFHNYVKPKKNFFPQYTPPTNKGHNSPLFVPTQNMTIATGAFHGIDNYGYATSAAQPGVEPDELIEQDEGSVKSAHLDVHMGANELYRNIVTHFKTNPQCRVSWLNRLLAKCQTPLEFHKAVKAFCMYQTKCIPTTPETGTLLIKAACRAGLPQRALQMLKDINQIRIFPTLGGIHYLMINFSLKRDTQAVMETFEVAKLRKLKPTTRTYHILIRECVDNDLIDDAMKFSKECQLSNIFPNRVTYNILMNGCRKFNKAKEILELREQMNEQNIEINDTTVKFTSLAHMMLGDVEAAVKSFLEFPELETKLEEFSLKFFEVTEENNAEQKKCVVDLFKAVEKQVMLPASISEKVVALENVA